MSSEVRILGANWCPDCKRAKQFLADQRVPYRFIDIEEDPSAKAEVEAKSGGKLIIPLVEFPDGTILIEPDNAEIAEKLGLNINAKKTFYELIIVGGGPAGLTAAIYAAREGIDVLILDKGALGGQAGVTERVDNYPGFPDGVTGAGLAELYVKHAARYGVEMLSGVAVEAISTPDSRIHVTTDRGVKYRCIALVVATGSTYRKLEVPGEDDLIGAGIHFCATCDGPFYKGAENLIVIGGGNSALEEGIFLTQFAKHVTILQALDELTASKILQDRVRNDRRFEVITSATVKEFVAGPDARLEAVAIEREGKSVSVPADGAFIFIGLRPNSGFIRDFVDTDAAGFIQTSPTMETSIPGVFAAGDVRKGSTKQIASAVGEGAAVLLMVRGYLEKQKEIAPNPL